jgi:hypothetical protein
MRYQGSAGFRQSGQPELQMDIAELVLRKSKSSTHFTQRGRAATKKEKTVFYHEGPRAAKPQPKSKQTFHHEGREEHEVRN